MSKARKTFRHSTVFAAVLAVFAVAVPSADAAPLGLVSLFGTGSVTVIDTQTGQQVGEKIATGGRPKSIAITPDARFAYVVNEESDEVSVIDLATRQLVGEPIPVGEEPGQIAIAPDGRTGYVLDYAKPGISVIDLQANRVTAEISLGAAPTSIAVAPDGKAVYVAEQEAQAVQAVSTISKAAIGPPIHLADRPINITIAPDGKTIYVGDELAGLAEVDVTTKEVSYVPIGSSAGSVTVSPDGTTALVSQWLNEYVSVVDLRTGAVIREVRVGRKPEEVSLTPNGKLAYVPDSYLEGVHVFNTQTFEEVREPIFPGQEVDGVTITPDRSPSAAFAPPSLTAGFSGTFSGAASTDPDGSIVAWNWSFGDGSTAGGIAVNHAYSTPGTYTASLRVVDNEGCGQESVFTGRTAYCSGNVGAEVIRPVSVAAISPVSIPISTPTVCPKPPRIGRVVHNRRNGTARLQVTIPATGSLYLFGKKVHAVTRRSVKAGSTFLTLHARVEVNKRLKKTHHTGVRYRVTFFPAAGCRPTTVHRSLALLRAPRKKH